MKPAFANGTGYRSAYQCLDQCPREGCTHNARRFSRRLGKRANEMEHGLEPLAEFVLLVAVLLECLEVAVERSQDGVRVGATSQGMGCKLDLRIILVLSGGIFPYVEELMVVRVLRHRG